MITGSLHVCTIAGKAERIAVPTLLINGVEDPAQDEAVISLYRRFDGISSLSAATRRFTKSWIVISCY